MSSLLSKPGYSLGSKAPAIPALFRTLNLPIHRHHVNHSFHTPPASWKPTVSAGHQGVPQSPPLLDSASPSPPLSLLPTSSLIRSYLLTTASSRPVALRISLALLSGLANSKSPLFSLERNRVLSYVVKKTLYAQYCAGETPSEVRRTVAGLKDMGVAGVILGYAREAVMDEGEKAVECGSSVCVEADVELWRRGALETVKLAEKGDFVALKFSGAGSQALYEMSHKLPPSKVLEGSIVEICETARARNVRLLFDAEQNAIQGGIDAWTMDFQRRYNQPGKGGALVYGTYQAYRRDTPTTLARHMVEASQGGFALGVKLVRGAYLGSDPRHLFWETKNETDTCYNGITEALVEMKWNQTLPRPQELETPPTVDVVLASHNLSSVKRAISMRARQLEAGQDRIEMVYGQLQGMADHVSCELIQVTKATNAQAGRRKLDRPCAYKYVVWGTVGECLKYLLRRAQENGDALLRTKESQRALKAECRRRLFGRLWPS